MTKLWLMNNIHHYFLGNFSISIGSDGNLANENFCTTAGPPLLSYLKLNYEKNWKKTYDILKPESLRDNVLYCLIYFMFFDNLTTENKKFWFPHESY